MLRLSILLGCVVVVLIGLTAHGLAGQADEPVLSPPEKASCTFPDGKSIKVNYASPRMRGRKIFGGLVPYGEVWRAGADEATTFSLNTPVLVQQTVLPAGNYTIFTLPSQSKWVLIISKETGEWGIPYPGQKSDFARADMQVSKRASPLEDFTISFEKASDRCTMRLDWETTRASVDITEKK
jgi:DUF2911 family protein